MRRLEVVLSAIAIIALILSAVSIYYASSIVGNVSTLNTKVSELSDTVTNLRDDVSRLTDRVAELEEKVGAPPPTPKPTLENLLAGYELRVGIILPLSGPLAYFGESGLHGAMMATEEINEAGGILGAKIKLIVEDFAGDPKIAVSATEKVITVDKVHVIRGYFTSSGAFAAVPIAEKYKVPVLSIGCSAKELCEQGWKYWFKTAPNSTIFNVVTVQFIKKVIEPTLKLGRPLKIAILHENTLMGESDKNEFLAQVEKLGVDWEIVAIEAYEKGAVDFKPVLEKLKAANPDIVVQSGYLTDTALIAKQSIEIGFNPIWISIGGAGGQVPALIDMAGEAVLYWFAANEFWCDRQYPNAEALTAFAKKFAERYGRPLDFQSWIGYAGMYMLKQVIEHYAKEDPETVKKMFETDDVQAIRDMIREGLATLKFYLDWAGDLYFYPNGQLAYSISGPEVGCTIIQVQPAKPGDIWSSHGLTFRTVFASPFKAADPIFPQRK